MAHKHDPGIYIIYVFSKVGRPKGYSFRKNYTDSVSLASRWKRITKGTASVHRCLYNNALGAPEYSE